MIFIKLYTKLFVCDTLVFKKLLISLNFTTFSVIIVIEVTAPFTILKNNDINLDKNIITKSKSINELIYLIRCELTFPLLVTFVCFQFLSHSLFC